MRNLSALRAGIRSKADHHSRPVLEARHSNDAIAVILDLALNIWGVLWKCIKYILLR